MNLKSANPGAIPKKDPSEQFETFDPLWFNFRIVTRKCIWLLFALLCPAAMLRAQGTAFNYQGRLNDGDQPANGIYDFSFWIYDSTNVPGVILAGPVTNSAVSVASGLFAAQMDFGPGVFNGLPVWLQIAVRTNGAATFTNLTPRQQLTPVPYAIFANTASNLSGTLPAGQLAGTLPASAFAGYTNTVALTNSANVFRGTFNGNGGGITNVNTANLTGVLTDAQLPVNTAYVNSNQTFIASNSFTGPNVFSGPNTFTNLYGNSFSGSFFGNGLVGWIAVDTTNVQAQIDHGYLLLNEQPMSVTLPTSIMPGDIVRISGAGPGGWRVIQNTNQTILGNFFSFSNSLWVSAGASGNWQAIASSSDGTRMAAVILNGSIYASQDSAKSWLSVNGNQPWRDIASSADGTRLAAASSMGIAVTTNSGSTWSWGGAANYNWYSIASSANGLKLAAVINGGSSTSGGLWTSTDGGASWTQRTGAPHPANYYSVACSADGSNIVAAVNGGQLYTSSDSGASWTARDSTRNWISLAASADGTKMIAAVNGGGIYVSLNSGTNWLVQTNSNLSTSSSWSCVAMSADGGRMMAGISGGGIYTSPNFGNTWSQQSAPSEPWAGIACSANGAVLAACYSSANGGIYYSSAQLQSKTTPGAGGGIAGPQGSAVELQYIGNNQFMPVSSAGVIWAN